MGRMGPGDDLDLVHFWICACHSCAGVFSVSFRLYRMVRSFGVDGVFLSQDSLSCIHVSKLRYVMVQSLAVFCSWCKSFFQDLAENSLQNVAQEGWSWLLERPKVRVSFARFRWNGAMLQFSAGMVLCRSFGGVSLSKI